MTALEKLLKGENLTEEEKTSLTPEEIAEGKRKELESIDGLRAERRRLEGLKDQETKKSSEDFTKKFIDEQTAKAEQFVFNDLTTQGIEMTEEKKAKIRDTRKKLDSGVVTYDNIVDDFYAAAAAVDKTSLFNDRKHKIEFEKEAAAFTSAGAGGGASGGSGTEGEKTYSQQVWDWVKEARSQGLNLTPEEAETMLTKGLSRTY